MTSQPYPDNPIELFNEWLKEAIQKEINDPNAMALATVGDDNRPSIRMILLKGIDDQQFIFYTNLESKKGLDLNINPNVALCFYWKSTHKQIRIEGVATRVSDAEADAYFSTRPIGAQLGAWASKQSQSLEHREDLETNLAHYALKFGDHPVPRPPHWSGFRVTPNAIEFWEAQPFRLHNRLLYTYNGCEWEQSFLYP